MNISKYLEQIEKECSQISYLSAKHILEKLYNLEKDSPKKEELDQLFENYQTYIKYLNDFAGPIYRRYNSSTEEIYDELCQTLDLSMDNEYLFEVAISKVEKQNAARIMQIEDDEFKMMTLEKFEAKLNNVKQMKYYKENISTLSTRIENAQKQFDLVRKALNI